MAKEKSDQKRSFMTLFKMFWLGFACVFCGGWIAFFPPPDLVEEIPVHKEIGYAFLTLGIIVLLALLFRRMHSFLMFVACGAVALGCAWVLVNDQGAPIWQMVLTGVFGLFMAFAAVMGLIAVFTGKNPMFKHLKNNDYLDGGDSLDLD